MDRVIDGIIPEDIVPVIKKDGVFQVYTKCPTPYKGNPCTGIVQCLDGPPPEYKRVYRCSACQTEYTDEALTWRPATRAEIQAYLDYKRAWHKIQFDAYQMAGNVLQNKMQNRNTVACYGLEILKYAVLLVLYQDYCFHRYHQTGLTRVCIGDELQMCKPDGRGVDNRELIGGVLLFLQEEELAEKNAHGRWKITAEGVTVVECCASDASVRA